MFYLTIWLYVTLIIVYFYIMTVWDNTAVVTITNDQCCFSLRDLIDPTFTLLNFAINVKGFKIGFYLCNHY